MADNRPPENRLSDEQVRTLMERYNFRHPLNSGLTDLMQDAFRLGLDAGRVNAPSGTTSEPVATEPQGSAGESPAPIYSTTENQVACAGIAERDAALEISQDIYRHANFAGVCYHEIWQIISKAAAHAVNEELRFHGVALPETVTGELTQMGEVQTQRVYGWYDRADQPIEQPTFNPSFPGPCLFCGLDTTEEDVRTHSIMPLDAKRSYFYRTHRTCHEGATDKQRNEIDGIVLDSIAHHGD